MGKGKYDEIGSGPSDHTDLAHLTIGIIIAQVVGLAMVILGGIWMGKYHNGYGWDVSTVFNYHPLFMTIGMIFLYGDGENYKLLKNFKSNLIFSKNLTKAILVYRLLRTTTKLYVKILHGIIHIAVLIFASIALKAVFDSHNKPIKPIPNMYSLHSWVGLTAVVLFGLQWIVGFVSFLFPKLSDGLRRAYLPHHKFWGLAIFGLCIAAALMGITEKAFFSLPK